MEFSKLTYFPFLKILLILIFGLITGIILKPSFLVIILVVFSGVSISLLLKNTALLYFSLIFASGFILVNNFKSVLHLKTTETFVRFKGLAFGKVTDVFISERTRAKLILEGNISYFGNKAKSFTALINIYDRDAVLPLINVGDELLFSGYFRLPRISKLPTDPDEIIHGLTNDFLIYGSTTKQNILYHWQKPDLIANFQRQVQNFLHLKLLYLYPNENFSLFSALLLGNRKHLPDELYRTFSLAGVAHLLALSGFHLGIIFMILYFVFKPVRNQWLKFLLVSFSLFLYLFVVGSPPSATRATIMVLAFFLASQFERRSEILNILAFILIIVLIFSPKMIFSPGFQMSYLSVLSIVLFNQRFNKFLQKIIPCSSIVLKYVLSILSVTISVQILLSPLFVYYFGFYSLASFFINIIVIPLFSLGIIYGFLSLLLSLLAPSIAIPYSALANFMVDLGKFIISFFSSYLPHFVIQNEYAIIVACIISLSLLLLSFSKGYLDFSVKTIILLILLYWFNDFLYKNEKRICYIPREECVLLTIELPSKNICFILDKKPKQRPQIDPYVAKYLESKMNNLLVGYTGNVGIAISDFLKDRFKFRMFTVSKDLQIRLSYSLFGDLFLLNRYCGRMWRFD